MTGCVGQQVVVFVHGCASGRADEDAFENECRESSGAR